MMKHSLLKTLALGALLLLAGCSSNQAQVGKVINLKAATANPATQGAVVAENSTPEFVVAWILWGTPTMTPYREPAAGSVAANPTDAGSGEGSAATPTTRPTLPPTATLRPTLTPAVVAGTGGGDASAGMQVFTALGGCSSCHDTSAGITIVGPTLKGIAARAAERKPEMTAEQYLHESIVDPNAFVVQGFAQGLMPTTFKSTLSEKQINDVVAYLMTLK
ncbi:MAG: c-type cytochrome [Anaerolineae bacterium]|nr:c-type cytochrome [Anaerolineae bacterium]